MRAASSGKDGQPVATLQGSALLPFYEAFAPENARANWKSNVGARLLIEMR